MHVERVRFVSGADEIVGLLHLPEGSDVRSAAVVIGPLTAVKEQAAGNHARALAERGVAALAFDHRFFGESGGAPRQYESPQKKIEDVQAALGFLEARPDLAGAKLCVLGVCAGGGYAAGAVAADPRVRAFAAVAGFFHDAEQQQRSMGAEYQTSLAAAEEAHRRWETSGVSTTIPAVGLEGPVAMPLAEAYAYYGTPRGAVAQYVNAFALMSRRETLPYDAQRAAPNIHVPTLVVHSEKALAPALARSFFAALAGPKHLVWLDSQGQIDFYDDPRLIGRTSELVCDHFRAQLDR